MKIKRIIFPVVSACLFSVAVYAQTVNYSGDWKRNDVLSNAGCLSANSVPITVAINQ